MCPWRFGYRYIPTAQKCVDPVYVDSKDGTDREFHSTGISTRISPGFRIRIEYPRDFEYESNIESNIESNLNINFLQIRFEY